MSDRTNLIDDDGENRAVRSFLALFQSGVGTVGTMARSMAAMGWTDEPAWVRGADSEPLTKAGAQFWIRHLLALEAAQPAPEKYEILVLPVCIDDVPDAHVVKLKVGSQQFQVGIDYRETKNEAEWFGAQVDKVLRKIAAQPAPDSDAKDAARYQWLRSQEIDTVEDMVFNEPSFWDMAIDAAMQQEQKS